MAGRAALPLARVEGRMAAWRRSGASGPQLVASYPRRGARTMRPLHHQVELNPPELSFRVGVAHSGGDPLGDAPEHPGESPVQGAGSDPAPSFPQSTVRARV